jgi:hypothetical protein
MENVCICYGHLEYLRHLLHFTYSYWVYFFPFWYVVLRKALVSILIQIQIASILS